jgi:hypothetical protein
MPFVEANGRVSIILDYQNPINLTLRLAGPPNTLIQKSVLY